MKSIRTEVRRLLLAGVKSCEVARMTGESQSYVHSHKKALGLPKLLVSSKESLAIVAKLRKEGMSNMDISRKTGMHATYVSNLLHLDRHRARKLTSSAIRSGKLVRPAACENCGGDWNGLGIDAHHTDYTKPLEVVWLCHLCHIKADAAMRCKESTNSGK